MEAVMKKGKAVFTAVILFAAGAAIFLTGWIQLRIPTGRYALLVSKTSGWGESMISPGTFSWSWEALLPTNLKIRDFKVSSVSEPFSASGTLPDAELYSAFLQERPSFSYAISGKIGVSPSLERLPSVIRSRSLLDQEALDAWLGDEARRACGRIAEFISRESSDQEFKSVLSKGGKALEEDILARLRPEFPDIILERLSLESSEIPDFALYSRTRELYSSFLGAQASAMNSVLREIAENTARDEYELESLARYGELLDKHPILIDFLAVRKGIPPGEIKKK
jgi:hypothetical protein